MHQFQTPATSDLSEGGYVGKVTTPKTDTALHRVLFSAGERHSETAKKGNRRFTKGDGKNTRQRQTEGEPPKPKTRPTTNPETVWESTSNPETTKQGKR